MPHLMIQSQSLQIKVMENVWNSKSSPPCSEDETKEFHEAIMAYEEPVFVLILSPDACHLKMNICIKQKLESALKVET